jgi:biotin synthase-related radical SAM superfamily protein
MRLLYQYNIAVGEKEGSFLGLAKKVEVFELSYRSSKVCICGLSCRSSQVEKGERVEKLFRSTEKVFSRVGFILCF